MGPVFVEGVVKAVREVEPDAVENSERVKKGWKALKPHRLVGVFVEHGETAGLLRVELYNGRIVAKDQTVKLPCQVYARGGRAVLVCYE